MDLYDAVAFCLGVTVDPQLVDAPVDDVKQMDLSPSKALTDFTWHPRSSFGDGVVNAVEWYQDHGVGETYTHLALKG